MRKINRKQDALDSHSQGRPRKIEAGAMVSGLTKNYVSTIKPALQVLGTDTVRKVRTAGRILHDQYPEILADAEMQANFAINNSLLKDNFPFSRLAESPANILVSPNLESGNIAYNILQESIEAKIVALFC